jgi:eukaryotic-like serine/threonine-protein kinase
MSLVVLNRLEEAKEVYKEAIERKVDTWGVHLSRYNAAFLEPDHAEMDRQLAWGTAQPGVKPLFEWDESDSAAFFGQLKRAREMSRRALESAARAGEKEIAAELHLDAALRDSELGDQLQAQQHINTALGIASTPEVQTLAALALARAGRVSESQKLAEHLAAAYSSNTLLNSYWLPTIRAAIELDRKNSVRAVETLRNAATYELSWFPPLEGNLYSSYLRGQAYLLLRQGNEAALEFEKFRAHPGTTELCLECACQTWPCARLRSPARYCKGARRLPGLPHALERRRLRSPYAERSQIGVRGVAISSHKPETPKLRYAQSRSQF